MSPYPYAYYRGKVVIFTRSEQFETSYFGGPGDDCIDGKDYGPSHIHHIARIANQALGIEGYGFGFAVPFYYGMCFDGCSLRYKRTAASAIEITEIVPSESSDDWPYPGFPPLLPYFPLKVEESKEFSFEEFSETVMQGAEVEDDDTLGN